jgi:hypothetical protein
MNKGYMILLAPLVIFFLYTLQWQSPQIDWQSKPFDTQSWYEMVHQNERCKHVMLQSMENEFDVFYVESIQPGDPHGFVLYFPAIEISTRAQHTAWLQIVRTDSKESKYNVFIDCFPEGYPFYTRNEIFYDVPCWYYSFFSKPVFFWEAHAYAVEIDEQNKTIACVGGVLWGYSFRQFSFRPDATTPQALSRDDWQQDFKVFQEDLADYKNISS